MSPTVSIDRRAVPIRLRLCAPDSDTRQLGRSILTGSDSVVFDLEDRGTERANDEGRDIVAGVSGAALRRRLSALVRVKGLSTHWSGQDRGGAAQAAVTDAVVPTVDSEAPVGLDFDQSGAGGCLTTGVPRSPVTAATERLIGA